MLVGLDVAGFLLFFVRNSDDFGLIDVFDCYYICFGSEFSQGRNGLLNAFLDFGCTFIFCQTLSSSCKTILRTSDLCLA